MISSRYPKEEPVFKLIELGRVNGLVAAAF
jgi:hypothetical protein